MGLNPFDERWLREVIRMSEASRDAGHHPFAAIVVDADGTVIARAHNNSQADRTSHAEMVALRSASAARSPHRLESATLFTSAEPCAMCAGGVYWAGVGRVVYALSEERLLAMTGADPENPTLSLPCRDVFARGQRPIEVVGPVLEAEALRVHEGFWRP